MVHATERIGVVEVPLGQWWRRRIAHVFAFPGSRPEGRNVMATLVLQAAGTALGSLLGPVGALVGGALGALGGSVVDQRLFGTGRSVEGPRLDSVAFQGGAEGTPLPRVYGGFGSPAP